MKSTRLASSPPRLAKWPWRAPTSTVLIEGVRQLGHVPSIPIKPPSNVPFSMAAALPEVEKCVTHRVVNENGLWAKCDCHSPPNAPRHRFRFRALQVAIPFTAHLQMARP